MDPKTVDRLETELEHAIAEAADRLERVLPSLPSKHTIAMMAKAATAVYEAAAEDSRD